MRSKLNWLDKLIVGVILLSYGLLGSSGSFLVTVSCVTVGPALIVLGIVMLIQKVAQRDWKHTRMDRKTAD